MKNQVETLKAEIAKLEAKYSKCVTRYVYVLGPKIRAKKAELEQLTK